LNQVMNVIGKNNVACHSTDSIIGQVFSLPYHFKEFSIYSRQFFQKLEYGSDVGKISTANSRNINRANQWLNVEHLKLRLNIYDSLFLKQTNDTFRNLKTVEYINPAPNYCLLPQNCQLFHFETQFVKIKSLVIKGAVKGATFTLDPLILLTPNIVELDIDHSFVMQTIRNPHRGSNLLFKRYSNIVRLTIREFNEFESTNLFYFDYFKNVNILHLSFERIKYTVYRTQIQFLEQLLLAQPKLYSLRMSNIKKPNDYWSVTELKENVKQLIKQYHPQNCTTWFEDDHKPDKDRRHYATLLFSK